MITFIAAVYNEEREINDLLKSIHPYVDVIRVVDDGSTDRTGHILGYWHFIDNFEFKTIPHTGLPETVKNEALQMVPKETDWVLMLDADERLDKDTLRSIRDWCLNDSQGTDYVYFRQLEIIDGQQVREYQKCKLFRPDAIRFPLNNIHADDQFVGNGTYHGGWTVYHRKTTDKQIQREIEYLSTYKRLLEEGKIDEGRYQWLINLHHYVRPHG
jgi:glycosyltransferase involved in cell wall biosynthesis